MHVANPPASTDVLIVGAGPTGLALAISLAQAGIDHVLIDRLDAGQNTSRAAVIHAHTLEALDDLGVAQPLAEAGLKLQHFSLRERDRTLVRLRFDALPSDFSYLLMITQDVTEDILAKRLEALGGQIYRGCTATSIETNRDGIRAWVQCGETQRAIDARYVVGADGMHSVVRKTANIPFDGDQYEHSFVLADVDMDWPLGRDEVMLFFTPTGPLVIAPLPSGRFRIVTAMEDAPAQPNVADIQAIIDAHGPTNARATVRDVAWGSRFRIHHRLARHYRKGRLLIMGDAAHVHSPAGGQGMNTGLVDATVLGRLLTAVVSGKKPSHVLDQYERLRRPAAAKVLEIAGGLTDMAMAKGALARAARDARLSVVDHVPALNRKLVMNMSGLSRRASAEVRV